MPGFVGKVYGMDKLRQQLEKLEAGIASGVLEFTIGNKIVRYKTNSDMLLAREMLLNKIKAQGGQEKSSCVRAIAGSRFL